jgi:GNAT superfamily N-acetyltransferase
MFKPIGPDEQAQALDLWHGVFGVPVDYFVRYYNADPWYQHGDSLGAWVDGVLVSAVHLCRRPLVWEGTTLLCGGIANVATRPEYRGRGLSRRLLSRATARMEEQGFAFSALGTGIPDFYAAQGWEAIEIPRFAMNVPDAQLSHRQDLSSARPTAGMISLYGQHPRVLQQERPERYFNGWVGWNWVSKHAQVLTLPGGYLILEQPEPEAQPVMVQEWRANDAATETELLSEAVRQACAYGPQRVTFAALPQHVSLTALEPLGVVERTHLSGKMTRNASLPENEYRRLRALYVSGQATLWPADGF